MSRKVLVYLVLASLSIEALGCTAKRTIVRGQSPDKRIDLAPLRRRIRRDVEPVLDARWKVHRRIEPALEVTKKATKKALTLTGYLAVLVGFWWLDQALTTLPRRRRRVLRAIGIQRRSQGAGQGRRGRAGSS